MFKHLIRLESVAENLYWPAHQKGKRVQVPWRALTVAAGALIVGGVLATSGGSDGNSDVSNTDDEDITLVLPTP